MKVSLRALRINAGLSQKDAAAAMGVSKFTILNWESNRTSPTALQLIRLCEVYHCEIGDILLPDK